MEYPFTEALDFIYALTPGSKVAIVGSRNYDKPTLVSDFVDSMPLTMIVVSGGCRANTRLAQYSVDAIAEMGAKLRGMQTEIYKAEWEKYKRPYGKNPAGMIRNREIIRCGLACLVAFRCCSGDSPGTDDAIRLANEAGIKFFVF